MKTAAIKTKTVLFAVATLLAASAALGLGGDHDDILILLAAVCWFFGLLATGFTQNP